MLNYNIIRPFHSILLSLVQIALKKTCRTWRDLTDPDNTVHSNQENPFIEITINESAPNTGKN